MGRNLCCKANLHVYNPLFISFIFHEIKWKDDHISSITTLILHSIFHIRQVETSIIKSSGHIGIFLEPKANEYPIFLHKTCEQSWAHLTRKPMMYVCHVIFQQKFFDERWCKSNSTNAQYVSLQVKIGFRKVKTCQFGLAKWFWPSIFCMVCRGTA
jgi:hypothetical protein